jgi:predicted O-methyltransferase YrrM
LIRAYLSYLLNARDEHALHSPFAFELYTEVIQEQTPFYAYEEIEYLRETLLQSVEVVEVTDLGAGSKVQKSNRRRLADIAKNSAKPPKYSQLLFRLVNHFRAGHILDLGTSLGLTTAYLAKANPQAQIQSLEGCGQLAQLAQTHLDSLSIQNVQIRVGDIAQTLTPALSELSRVDLAFFDANHRFLPTMQYFETCLPWTHSDSVLVFDDIHWSGEMEQAWRAVQGHSAVTMTMDLFGVGLVFFQKKWEKQHFVLRF